MPRNMRKGGSTKRPLLQFLTYPSSPCPPSTDENVKPLLSALDFCYADRRRERPRPEQRAPRWKARGAGPVLSTAECAPPWRRSRPYSSVWRDAAVATGPPLRHTPVPPVPRSPVPASVGIEYDRSLSALVAHGGPAD